MARQNQVQMTKNDRRKKRRSEIPESIRGIVDILETALPNTQLQELLETAVEGASSGSSLQLSTNELRNLSQDIFEKIKHCLANGDLAANDDLENALEVFLDESQDSLDENARKTIAKRIVELHEERRADRVIAAEKREELGELLQPLLRRLRAFPLAGQPGSRYDSLEELAAELAELPIEFDFLKHENFESLDELVDALAVLVQEHSGSELSHREAYYISDLLVLHRSTYAIFQAIEDSATAQIMRAATGEATPNNSSPIFDNREFFSRYPSLREECESRFESRKQALTRELDTELADFAELTLSLQEALARDVLDAGELSELLLRVSGLEHGDLFLQYFEAASSESLESALADFLKSEDVEIVSDLLGHDPTTLAALQLATDFSLLERSHAEEPARRAEIEDSLVHSIIGGPEELLKRYDSLFGTLANDRALFSPRALIAIEAREENNTALLAAVELKRQIEDQGEGFSLDKLLQFLNQHSPEDRGEILKQFQERFSIDLIEVFSTGELPGALYSNGTSQRNGVTLYVSDEDRQVRAALLEATVSGDEQLFRAAKLREIVLRGQQESMFHGEGSHQTLSEILAYYSTQEDFRLVELRSAYESRFSSNLTQDIEHSFDSADYVDQYQQRHQGT
ncbi:MAG: hypothetical protein KDD64_17105, partial [Bdellovibrionales bacterium]|nr:hypothetical protein [Bdellovibrionales bacterium]